MTEQSKRMYCPSCGEEVETFLMLEEEKEVYRCFICGMDLPDSDEPSLKPLDLMLVAEDSMVFREVLKDKILELGIARQVELAENGEEFLTAFTRSIASSQPVSLAVLDIRMPGMNGVNAAMAMRAVERGLEKKRRVPILFFSSLKCDETLKNVFKQCAPARYINKGNSASPEDLSDRLVQVISRLMSEGTQKK